MDRYLISQSRILRGEKMMDEGEGEVFFLIYYVLEEISSIQYYIQPISLTANITYSQYHLQPISPPANITSSQYLTLPKKHEEI